MLQTHSENHWQTEATYKELIEAFVVQQEVSANKPCLLLHDVYTVHRKDTIISFMNSFPGLHFVYIPAGATSLLQPLDLSYNAPMKAAMRIAAAMWMYDAYKAGLTQMASLHELRARLYESVVNITKSLHERRLVRKGWHSAGLLGIFTDRQAIHTIELIKRGKILYEDMNETIKR